jgi:hypothetical protein
MANRCQSSLSERIDKVSIIPTYQVVDSVHSADSHMQRISKFIGRHNSAADKLRGHLPDLASDWQIREPSREAQAISLRREFSSC